jgi:hypothetical protein
VGVVGEPRWSPGGRQAGGTCVQGSSGRGFVEESRGGARGAGTWPDPFRSQITTASTGAPVSTTQQSPPCLRLEAFSQLSPFRPPFSSSSGVRSDGEGEVGRPLVPKLPSSSF